MNEREHRRHVAELWSASSPRGSIATAHHLATAAGVEALEQGGNAVDAAVAASLALGVCEPAGSGLGGMAMMLVHLARPARTFALCGPCRAPRRATPEEVSRSHRYCGYRAVAVPTHVSVLKHALERHGTLSRDAVLGPAIRLAEAGFPLTRLHHAIAEDHKRALGRSTAAPFFLEPDGRAPAPGSILRQPVLARTLRRLAERGFDDFYRGEIAHVIGEDMRLNGGFVERDDLEDALSVEESAPLTGDFDGDPVLTVGPPAGGLALLQMLQMASLLPAEDLDLDTAEGVVRVAALIRRARLDRRAFSRRIGAAGLGRAAELLQPDRAARALESALAGLTPRQPPAPGHPPRLASGETSHISVMDGQGNVVSLTQSIERAFGAAVVTPSLGFLYNGYLRAFKVTNRRHPHYLRPGAVARSNAAPTIAFRNGKPWACLGSTGSERMSSGIFEVLLRLRHDTPFDAVHAPRLHCTPKRLVLWEEQRFPVACREALLGHGFRLRALRPYSFKMGGLQLVVSRDGQYTGVAEPRRDGSAGVPAEPQDFDVPRERG